jgi:1-acyl-sn-glycerol-3-phosphate acyltransferase
VAAYGKALTPWYFSMTNAMRAALLLLARWRVEGKEAVPPRGPLIIVSNHLSHIDPPMLAASIPRNISFLAKQELFAHPVFGRIVKWYGALPVDREVGANNKESLDRVLEVLAQDGVIGVFPEGTRSKKGGMQRAKAGVALLAMRSQAPILPVGIYGSERVRGIGSLFTRPRITVSIGSPFTLPALEGPVGHGQLASVLDMIMGRIAAQIPAGYRGVYAIEKRVRASVPQEQSSAP